MRIINRNHNQKLLSIIHMIQVSRRVCRSKKHGVLLQLAIEQGAPIENGYCTYLEAAVMRHDIKRIHMLIKCGANVNAGHGFPVRRACYQESVDILDILIKAGADVNLGNFMYSSMWDAIMYRSSIIVSKLLAAGAIIPPDTMDLASKSRKDSVEKIRILSEYIR